MPDVIQSAGPLSDPISAPSYIFDNYSHGLVTRQRKEPSGCRDEPSTGSSSSDSGSWGVAVNETGTDESSWPALSAREPLDDGKHFAKSLDDFVAGSHGEPPDLESDTRASDLMSDHELCPERESASTPSEYPGDAGDLSPGLFRDIYQVGHEPDSGQEAVDWGSLLSPSYLPDLGPGRCLPASSYCHSTVDQPFWDESWNGGWHGVTLAA